MQPVITQLYGIIGYPLGHSLSPLLHTAAFRALDIPAVHVAWPVEPGRLADFMAAFRLLGLRGLSVTIPHKEAIMPLLDEVSDRAKKVGAVNLVYWREGRVVGDNTDVIGFMGPLGDEKPRRALVLGTGGAAKSAIAGLAELGWRDVTVAYRSRPLPGAYAARFGLKQAPWAERGQVAADLVVNATPLGMQGPLAGETPYPAQWLAPGGGLAYDIVYTPFTTRFLREAAAAGWRAVGGQAMFLGQAEAQFKAWTGRGLPAAARELVKGFLQQK